VTPEEAAQKLADCMNEIEKAGYILYPHPRPVGIGIRKLRHAGLDWRNRENSLIVSYIWDQGKGKGWEVKRG
jgi:hypothetical protein